MSSCCSSSSSSSSSDSGGEAPAAPPGGVPPRLEGMATKLEQLRQRRDGLRDMRRGMGNNGIFSDAERRAVQIQLEECEAAYAFLHKALFAKAELYHSHVKRLEERLRLRREFLAGFDSVLECEPTVAETLITEQRELQKRLDDLYSIIDKAPTR